MLTFFIFFKVYTCIYIVLHCIVLYIDCIYIYSIYFMYIYILCMKFKLNLKVF